MFEVSSVMHKTTHSSLSEAVRACSLHLHMFSAFGPTISNEYSSVSFELIDVFEDLARIDQADIDILVSLFDVDIAEFHWPYAPTTEEVANALAKGGY